MISISEAAEMDDRLRDLARSETTAIKHDDGWDNRPDWDTWFMALALVVSQRSLDKTTKHGCVIVDESKSILSVGYNSPPRNCDDELVPQSRPAKYLYMEHAESNAINNAARCGTPLNNSIFYVTGHPCNACFRRIINVGAVEIVHGPISHQKTEDEDRAIELMNSGDLIKIRSLSDISHIVRLLNDAKSYLYSKVENT